ncbi:glutathione S-transferase family protein [Cupriavidus malaysiensis]|uniref:Glutathione S-transferase n=1 Tax=Cupriavidus malaysiensis TaxID=367825 RepID=A0ABN4TET8_9BURK|nr:glutathione S-transferase [Cupriavidus malaysiensis]AOZ05668.1 glutathione S-transferase [Cupriavidus malaysiensis]
MQLIGMLDSPYVRRTAISLRLLGLPYEHKPVSVFSTYDAFRAINPVVKAPTLVCDDGQVLMDSTLIIDYAETVLAPGRSLMPAEPRARTRALRRVGLALAACEKAVQIVYERGLRPEAKRHAPWLERVTQQLHAACAELEGELLPDAGPLPTPGDQAGVTIAVTWRFIQMMVADVVVLADYPLLNGFSLEAEGTEAFLAAPAE